jgi:hypothetical protein
MGENRVENFALMVVHGHASLRRPPASVCAAYALEPNRQRKTLCGWRRYRRLQRCAMGMARDAAPRCRPLLSP